MKYTAVLAMVACATSASATAPVPTFQQLGEELRDLSADPQVQNTMKAVQPLVKKLGLNPNVDPNVDLSPAGILQMISTIDNSVGAFHDVVDSAGGQTAFQNAGNAVTSAYVAGLLGHLNAQNVESAKMAQISTDVQAVFTQSVELIYVDMYNVFNTDISNKLIMDAISLVEPASKILADIKNIISDLKDLFGGNKRALLEQLEEVSDEALRVLEAGDITKENFICKMQPVVMKITNILSFLTSDEIKQDMVDVAKLMSDLPSSNNVVAALQVATDAISDFLNTHDAMIHDMIIPTVQDVDKYIGGLCTPKTSRVLADTSLEFNPFAILIKIFKFIEKITEAVKIFDFLEKVTEDVIHFMEHLPEPLGKDTLKVIYDIIALVAPQKAGDVKEIVADVGDLTQEMALLLPALNTTMGDLHQFFGDCDKTVVDLKVLISDIIALLKTIV